MNPTLDPDVIRFDTVIPLPTLDPSIDVGVLGQVHVAVEVHVDGEVNVLLARPCR